MRGREREREIEREREKEREREREREEEEQEKRGGGRRRVWFPNSACILRRGFLKLSQKAAARVALRKQTCSAAGCVLFSGAARHLKTVKAASQNIQAHK